MADEEKKVLINIEDNLNDYISRAVEAKKRMDEMRETVNQLKEDKKTEGEEWEKANAELRDASREYNNAKKAVDLQTTANKSNAESRKQLNAIYELEKRRLGELANQYAINDKGQRVLSQSYMEQVARLKDAKDAIIAYDKAQSDGRSSVGLYSEAIEGAIGKFQALPGPIGSAVSSVQSFGTALKALLLNPVTAAITALVGVLALLFKAFRGNDEAATKMDGIMKGLKLSITEVLGRVFTLGKAVGALFRGDFKEAAELAKEAVDNIGGSLKNAMQVGFETEAMFDELNDREIAFIEVRARREKEIAELKLKSRDEAEGSVKQAQYLKEAQDLINQNLNDELSIQQRRVEIMEKVLAATNKTQVTDAQRQELAEARAKLLEMETRALDEQGGLMRRLNSLEKLSVKDIEAKTKEMEKQKDLLNKELEDFKKRMDEIRAAEIADAEDRKQRAIEQADWERERNLINAEALLEIRELNYQDEFATRRQQLAMIQAEEIRNAEQTGADINLINQKYALANRQITEAEQQAKLSLYADFAGNIAQIFGENTKIGRMAAIAQTTISTYQSAVEAYKSLSGIPVVGPALGIAAAAAAIASGIATVKKIASVKSGLKGDSGGGSAPTSISASFPAQRTFAQQVLPTSLTQPQLTQGQINALPNQNVLTAEDIARAVEKLPAPIVTVEDINARTAEKRKVETRATV